jgi:arylsulfatase
MATALLASLLAVALLPACDGTPSRPNFLFITVDALRADHMSIYGYQRPTSPRIDEFFANGTVYEYAYSTEANTGPSVVSFLSGLLPQDNGVRLQCQKVPPQLRLVSDYLSETGYRTAAIISNAVLTSEYTDLDKHFDYYDDFVDEQEPYRLVFERNGRATTDAGVEWFVKAYDHEKPFFLWIHYQDTHGPYRPPDDKPVDFKHKEPVQIEIKKLPHYHFDIGDFPEIRAGRNPGKIDGAEQVDLYDEELAYMDEHVGRLLDLFLEQSLLKNTVVIFSADHGESMMEHEQWFTHGYHVYEEIARVPLLFRHPQQHEGTRVQTRVSLIDVVPTILDLAGVVHAEQLRGQVLDDSVEDRPIYVQGSQWRSMTFENQKWIIEVDDSTFATIPRHRFDLDSDPKELKPVEWTDTAESARFFELISNDPDPGGIPMEFIGGMSIDAPKVRPGLDEETLKKLRALGYVK